MRLTKYTVEFDEARKPILAKERSFNYSAAEQLNTPEKIVELIIDVFRATSGGTCLAFSIKCKTKTSWCL